MAIEMYTPLLPHDAKGIIARFRDQTALIIGDVMLDKYIVAHARGETDESGRPTPKFSAQSEQVMLGGAGCVMVNARGLGANVLCIGVVGKDPRAHEVRDLLHTSGISTDTLVEDHSRPTTLKARIVFDARHVMRCDIEQDMPVPSTVEQQILSEVSEVIGRASCVVLADYDKGVLTPRVIAHVLALARANDVPVFVDPKYRNFWHYGGAYLVKPNRHEIERVLSLPLYLDPHTVEDRKALCARAKSAARQVTQKLKLQHTLLTLGPGGMVLDSAADKPLHFLGLNKLPVDILGAGDSVIATLAISAAAGATIAQAAALASVSAYHAVSRFGAAPTSANDLLDKLALLNDVAQIERTEDGAAS